MRLIYFNGKKFVVKFRLRLHH